MQGVVCEQNDRLSETRWPGYYKVWRGGQDEQGITMAEPVLFYPFKKDPLLEVSPSFGEQLGINFNERCQTFMDEDLARSGLTSNELFAYPAPMAMRDKDSVLAAYKIPYWHPDGTPITGNDGYCEYFACRNDISPLADPEKTSKYYRPGAKQVGDVVCRAPYIHPWVHEMKGDTVAVCEGEKKALSVMKHLNLPAIGIGGMGNWRAMKGQVKLHPWILDWLKDWNPEHIVLIPDGDIVRYDIKKEYGTFKSLLKKHGYNPVILQMPDKVDDLLMEWHPDERLELFKEIPVLEDHVENAQYLIDTYGLSYIQGRGAPKIEINESNLALLYRKHPSIPAIWMNLDEHRIYVKDEPVKEGVHDFDLLAHTQHNLGLSKAKMGPVYAAMVRVATENARSPMLDWIHSLEWDGVPRIARLFSHYCGSLSTPSIEDIGMKWLVSSIGRMTNPGCKVDWMLVTVGTQGIGKSSLPGIIFGPDRVVNLVGTENQMKDMLVKMHMGLCVNFEELAVMRHKEISHLKAVISNTEDTFRAAYARYTITKSRRFVLYGSTNTSQFLTFDPSGQRRYAVVPITQVNFKAVEKDRAQLWAEALHVYKSELLDFSNILQDESIDGHVQIPYYIENLDDAFNEETIPILDWEPNFYVSNIEIKLATRMEELNPKSYMWGEICGYMEKKDWKSVPNGPKVKGKRNRRGWVKEKPPGWKPGG